MGHEDVSVLIVCLLLWLAPKFSHPFLVLEAFLRTKVRGVESFGEAV